MADDGSNGWDGVAAQFARLRSTVGVECVRRWAGGLPCGGAVLDAGAGTGDPVTTVLIDAGLNVRAIDASPAMVRAFRTRHPGVPVACETLEFSRFDGAPFDGVLAIGVMFLLPEATQRRVIHRLARILKPTGALLFTAPREACSWHDSLTGRRSVSLGLAAYQAVFDDCGLAFEGVCEDEGGNHHIAARKLAP